MNDLQEQRTRNCVDSFYAKKGPCCAGCDHWRYYNSIVGECIKTAPVSGTERWAMIAIMSPSIPLGAGHIITERHHLCGDFYDSMKGKP